MRTLLIFTIVTSTAFSAMAAIHILDNSASAMPSAYTTAQGANDSALVGDTIFVIGSGIYYGTLNTTKTLKWFGPGFYLSSNPETQANNGAARFPVINVNAGSQGSLFTGLQVESGIYVNTGNILIRRCLAFINGSGTFAISVTSGVSNVTIEQCYIYSTASQYIVGLNSSHSVTIQNCFLQNIANSGYAAIISNIDGGPYTILNNVLIGGINVNNALINNNIMVAGYFTPNNSGYNNNIANSTQFGSTNGNQINVTMNNTMFIQGVSPDGSYKLASGSVAHNAGVGGVD